MLTIAHISDLHFGREVPDVIQGLMAALAQVEPDLVIISGDLTQRAKVEEFEAAKVFLQQLPYPYFIIPGNHDISATDMVERFFRPWEKWQQFVTPNLEPVLQTNQYIVVGINTARAAGWYFDWSRGQISPAQIQFVADTIKPNSENKLRLVVAHHPFWLPENAEYRDVVENRDQAIETFDQAGVDIILSGHIHMAYTQILQGIIISHAGTTFSNRLLESHPNSFNIITGDRKQLTISFMEWQNHSFQLKQSKNFVRISNNWQQV
ncbi:metallophosphoesterase family protein [Thiofilum flexile]|uniref:metallophosphoesterase family protein n=1 Tax=Thiofilum flexile TaxID=125627 RepID=UPI00037D2794|nr:metallophosphoesterase family protein [Thiofilum flexile]